MKTEATRERSLLRPGLLLDDRGQRHEFLDGRDRQILPPPFPDVVDQLLLVGDQLVDDLLARRAAAEAHRVGGDTALRRLCRRQVAAQRLMLGDALERLLDGQPFGDRQRIKHGFAALQQFHDVEHGGSRLDLVFAGLERVFIAIGADADPEDAGIADQAAPFQLLADFLNAGAGLDHDRGGGRRGPGRLEGALAEIGEDAAGNHQEEQRRDQEIQEHDKLVARLARAPRRRRAGLGTQRFGCRLRHDDLRRHGALTVFTLAWWSGVHGVAASPVARSPATTLVPNMAKIAARSRTCNPAGDSTDGKAGSNVSHRGAGRSARRWCRRTRRSWTARRRSGAAGAYSARGRSPSRARDCRD